MTLAGHNGVPRPERLLVVDAQPDLLAVLPGTAMGSSLQFELCAGLETTLAAVERNNFGVVVADIDTPGGEDIELLRQLRDRKPEARVVVVSSHQDPAIAAGLIRQRAYAILVRPLLKDKIRDAIEHALVATNWHDEIELISVTPTWVQVRVACKLAAADRAVQLFRELPSGLAAQEHEELSTALREMLMNAIEHGAHSDEALSVYVDYIRTDRDILLSIKDPGPGFSMSELSHAAVSNAEGSLAHAEVREQRGIRPGGFGILLAKNMVDEMIYNERGNEVLLVKHRV